MEPSSDRQEPVEPKAARPVKAPRAASLPAGLREMYVRHQPFVLNLIRRMDPREADAEDIAQDVFLQAGKKLGDYDPSRGSEQAWLAGFVVRLVSRSKRKARREVYVDPGERPARGTPERCLGAREVAAYLLRKIPEEQRIVLLLHDHEGLPRSEIAEQLEIPEGTVSTRLNKARDIVEREIARLCARDGVRPEELRFLPFPLLAGAIPRSKGDWLRALGRGPWTAGGAGLTSGTAAVAGGVATKAIVLTAAQLAGGALALTVGAGLGGAALHAALHPSPAASIVVAAEVPPAPSPARVGASTRSAVTAQPTSLLPGTDSAPSSAASMSAATAAITAASAAASNSAAPIVQETADSLMNRIRTAVEGNPAQALGLVERHAKLFPGKNTAEREAYAILALARAGQRAAASARAEGFRKTYPRSAYLGAIDAAVGSKL